MIETLREHLVSKLSSDVPVTVRDHQANQKYGSIPKGREDFCLEGLLPNIRAGKVKEEISKYYVLGGFNLAGSALDHGTITLFFVKDREKREVFYCLDRNEEDGKRFCLVTAYDPQNRYISLKVN